MKNELYCQTCNQETIIKNGKSKDGEQRYLCTSCGSHKQPFEPLNSSPKILVFDIESTPSIGYFWSTNPWNVTMTHDKIIQDWYMLSWSAKWLNDSEIINDCIKSKESVVQDDRRIVKSLWKLFDEADILIAHNGHKFDIPMMNTKFLQHNILPPKPYQVIDTLKVAKRSFKFTHNKLDYLGEFLGIGRKNTTEFQLWLECMAGNKKSLKRMLDYNDQDVLLLEEVYYKLLPYTKSHPNLNNYQDTKKCCSNCGSSNIRPKGFYHTMVNRYQTFQCSDCGSFTRVGGKMMQPLAR